MLPDFCHCGKRLKRTELIGRVVLWCEDHGFDFKLKPTKNRVAKYSGKSRSVNAFNDYRG